MDIRGRLGYVAKVLRWWGAIVTAVLSLAGYYDLTGAQFLSEATQKQLPRVSTLVADQGWSVSTWVALILLVLLITALEGGYRHTRRQSEDHESALAQLRQEIAQLSLQLNSRAKQEALKDTLAEYINRAKTLISQAPLRDDVAFGKKATDYVNECADFIEKNLGRSERELFLDSSSLPYLSFNPNRDGIGDRDDIYKNTLNHRIIRLAELLKRLG